MPTPKSLTKSSIAMRAQPVGDHAGVVEQRHVERQAVRNPSPLAPTAAGCGDRGSASCCSRAACCRCRATAAGSTAPGRRRRASSAAGRAATRPSSLAGSADAAPPRRPAARSCRCRRDRCSGDERPRRGRRAVRSRPPAASRSRPRSSCGCRPGSRQDRERTPACARLQPESGRRPGSSGCSPRRSAPAAEHDLLERTQGEIAAGEGLLHAEGGRIRRRGCRCRGRGTRPGWRRASRRSPAHRSFRRRAPGR